MCVFVFFFVGFFFNDTATTEIYTLSLHDALPIPDNTSVYFQSSRPAVQRLAFTLGRRTNLSEFEAIYGFSGETNLAHVQAPLVQVGDRSEEHTSELQSRTNLVCRLLLEKKKQK